MSGATREIAESNDALLTNRLVVSAARVCVDALSPLSTQDWRSVRAHDLEWSVWDTLVHLNDDLYFYAAQILLASESDYICFELSADDHADSQRLLTALTVNARLLAAVAADADPSARGHHVFGASDPAGFAAMGMVESLIHTYDMVRGLDEESTWQPPDDLAGPVLRRLFPHAPHGADAGPGEVLLHMCGRIPLGNDPRRSDWRWYGDAQHPLSASSQAVLVGDGLRAQRQY
ncbi:hypothetical protein [Rudaeicoccus suwonensis]|uniref:Mycothiol maleylpyruvate isomerase-like protein n=1 Tax=Rudaeicoccus suwonensis TaxID=657409 RepID=A0A561E457_9MICO|nr:hypothetical protein [Rudaeicoccus suwonensis]TWE10399.1 hypothetical protein BKA23_2759 [Rudaeicoccus suwonensis]